MSQINTYESVTYTGPISSTQETTPLAGLIAGAVFECGRAAGRGVAQGRSRAPRGRALARGKGRARSWRGASSGHDRECRGGQQSTAQDDQDQFVVCSHGDPLRRGIQSWVWLSSWCG